ncbi:MAG: hypothetical protein HC906_17050 [Bacteroidales bacterium]|nr:hypothetical protein [Bacteroidales bacterium]
MEICEGDTNNDSKVDGLDYINLLAKFNDFCNNCPEDFNLDGIIDGLDYLVVLGNFSNICF